MRSDAHLIWNRRNIGNQAKIVTENKCATMRIYFTIVQLWVGKKKHGESAAEERPAQSPNVPKVSHKLNAHRCAFNFYQQNVRQSQINSCNFDVIPQSTSSQVPSHLGGSGRTAEEQGIRNRKGSKKEKENMVFYFF